MPKVSPQKRARIAALLSVGLSTRDIARRERVSQSTVSRLRHYNHADRDYQDLPRGGAPRLLTDRHERLIVRMVKSGKCQTAIDVQSCLREEEDIHVSYDTVRNVFQRNNMRQQIKRRKPLLTKKQRRDRVAFAKEHKHWTVEDWNRVVWSDESQFKPFGSFGKQHCWMDAEEPSRDAQVQPTVKHGGGNIMVWGCFTTQGVGHLCRIIGGLDAKLYRQILSDEMMKTLKYYHLTKADVVFQHDNDPKHRAKLVKKWFKVKRVQVLTWPSQSPDLNPIKQLWSKVKRRLWNLPERPTSLEDLWDKVQDVWNGIEVEECTKLIETMPERIRDVLKARGGYTRW